MKHPMSWTLRLHARGKLEEFKKAVRAVLKHHFHIHNLCGNCCETKCQLKSEKQIVYRCKDKNKELYVLFKKHHDEFMEEDGAWKELHHLHDGTMWTVPIS
jgi:hypothetical protein